MKKFDFNDYTLGDIGTTFLLSGGENKNYSFIVTLGNHNGELKLLQDPTKSDVFFNLDDAPYIVRVIQEKHQKCTLCNKKAVDYIIPHYLCKHHFDNEVILIKMKIRDFLYKVENEQQFNILKENLDQPYIHNEQDLKYPFYGVVHHEFVEQWDISTYTLYIINSDMKDVVNGSI